MDALGVYGILEPKDCYATQGVFHITASLMLKLSEA